MADKNVTGRILVFDDAPADSGLLTAYLISAGHEVLPVTDPASALDLVRSDRPDLVLIGLDGPSRLGIKTCKWIKNGPDTQQTPVMLVGSAESLDDRLAAGDGSADDFVTRPLNRTELLLRVESLLRLRSLQERMGQRICELQNNEARLRRIVASGDRARTGPRSRP